ncbi:MAG: FAD binding domain-containing protein [Pseudomonadales bacterium]|nr:FAD binding domain-containing protein [Pseudomonadales bacterium]
MGSFAYTAPKKLEQALAVLNKHAAEGNRIQVLAGGTDLLVQLKSIDSEPRTILDIKKIAETSQLTFDGDHVFIGSTISCAVLYENAELKEMFPGLTESIDLIGSTQIQGKATLGGNLCNASPAGDTISALFVNGATCVIANESGLREMPVDEFVVGVGRNALQPGELLLGLKLPKPAANTSDAYLRFIPRTEMDIAVAGAAVSVSLDDNGVCVAARVAIGAVATTALNVPAAVEALVGSALDASALQKAAEASSAASSPISDKRGTEEFRRKIVGVLTKRAATTAYARAKGEG